LLLRLRARAKAWAAFGFVLAMAAAGAPAPVSAATASVLTQDVGSASRLTVDVDCLAAAIYYEARGESVEGQAAVAQVVLNRSHGKGFPKTICGVIYQGAPGRGCQFSFVCSGAMVRPRQPTAWAHARDVAVRALSGYVMSAVGAATSFHLASLGSGPDRHMARVAQIGAHVFLVNAAAGFARANSLPAPATDHAAPIVLAAS
jgi:spore germination cell wall hydrolase CwlJ-like protein